MNTQSNIEIPGGPSTFGQLYKNIFFKPSLTLLEILSTNRKEYNVHFFILAGIYTFLNTSLSSQFAPYLPPNANMTNIILMSVAFGGVVGYLSGLLWGWILQLIGKKLGSQAPAAHYRTVYAWSLAPVFISFILFFAQIMLLGTPASNIEPGQEIHNQSLVSFFGIASMAISIIQLFILLRGLQILHQGRSWRAFANMIIPNAIVIMLAFFFLSLV